MRIPNLFDGAKIGALSWAAKKNRQTTRKNRQTAKEVASKGAKRPFMRGYDNEQGTTGRVIPCSQIYTYVSVAGRKAKRTLSGHHATGHVAGGRFDLLRNTYNLSYYHDRHGN